MPDSRRPRGALDREPDVARNWRAALAAAQELRATAPPAAEITAVRAWHPNCFGTSGSLRPDERPRRHVMNDQLVFQKAIDALPYGVTLWEADSEDVDGLRLVYANPQASREADVDLQRFVGRSLPELLPGVEREEPEPALSKRGLEAALHRIPHSVPRYRLPIGGEPRHFRVHLVPVWDRTVAVVYERLKDASSSSSSSGDIPNQTRDFFEDVVETLHEPLLVLDAGRHVLWGNRMFAELTGVAVEELPGLELSQISGRSGAHGFGEALAQILSGSSDRQRGEIVLQHASGPRTLLVHVRRLPGGQEPSGPVLVALRDVSAERSADALQRELVQRLLDTRDEERRRLALELHDHVGQSLELIAARVQQLGEASIAADQVHALLQDIGTLGGDVSRLASGLHPVALDQLGFEAAVRQQLRDFARTHPVRVDVAITGLDTPGLDPDLALALYRMIQEGLTNVARHAEASSVNLVVHREPSRVRVVLEDDGVGFDPEADPDSDDPAAPRLGLIGVRERAALLGGEVELESTPGRGTTLAISVPAS